MSHEVRSEADTAKVSEAAMAKRLVCFNIVVSFSFYYAYGRLFVQLIYQYVGGLRGGKERWGNR